MPATVYLWNKAPFVRLLPALIGGIVLQWHLQLSFSFLAACFLACLVILLLYSFLPLTLKFRLGMLNGIGTILSLLFFGALLVWAKDIRHNKEWIGHDYNKSFVMAALEEPLVEKQNSFKALASLTAVCEKNSYKTAVGKVIIYFKKDTSVNQLRYGSQIVFKKSLQEIKNAGNPGSFDYKRYSLFQGITHQVYLTANDFKILPLESKNIFDELIFNCREWVLSILRKFIRGAKEQGLAEALLIGYKDDLDKNLVQAYTNTGVVHVIAISGLHLGLIYWLLLLLTKPFRKHKKLVWLRLLIIVASLWLFSLLAGGQPSVLRSAVMFTCIAAGEVILRKTSIYNTLALSAFLLLCYNPYWLWDVGFQLSYTAVLSIVMFFQPIYNWFYFPNKTLDFLWKLNAVTLAAQLLTLPISVYHFHQIPTLFLFTNMVAVPLSSIILIGEIVLCALFFIEPVAQALGTALKYLIYLMNAYIERLDSVYFSIWNGLSITVLQTFLLLGLVVVFCFWLLEKKKAFLWVFAGCLALFTTLRSVSMVAAHQQKKIIVYNVPKYQAIDLIVANSYYFIGDSALLFDDFIRNFHIQPSRIANRIAAAQGTSFCSKDFDFANKHVAILDTTLQFSPQPSKQKIDLLILSKNPRLYISNLATSFCIGQIVIDGSVPPWKARLWKRDCDSLHIPCHDVSEKGAFVMNL
jgi:competence protein ComEC